MRVGHRWILAALLGWAGTGAQAFNCNELGNRPLEVDTHYLVAYLDLGQELSLDKRRRIRTLAEDRLNPQLSQLADEIHKTSGATRRRHVKLVACDLAWGPGGLASSDLDALMRYKAIAALKRGDEEVSYVTLPFFTARKELQLEDVQAALGYTSGQDIQNATVAALEGGQALRRVFVGLGLALALARDRELAAAWAALCESRKSLEAAAAEVQRPSRDQFMQVIGGLIEAEAAAARTQLRGSVPEAQYRPPEVVQRQCRKAPDLGQAVAAVR